MPPRHAYWTIMVDDQPTSFRAHDVEELLPTYNRLREKHPSAILKWFERGQLWESREAARAQGFGQGERRWEGPRPDRDGDRGTPTDDVRRSRPDRPDRPDRAEPPRDRKWRPGGEHRDPRQKYKDAKKAKWQRFKQDIRGRWEEKQREGGKLPPPEPDRGEHTPPHGDPMRPKVARPARPDSPASPASPERAPASRGERADASRGERADASRGEQGRGARPEWRREDRREAPGFSRGDRGDRPAWKPKGERPGWKPRGKPSSEGWRRDDHDRGGWKPKDRPPGDRGPASPKPAFRNRAGEGGPKSWGTKPGPRKPWSGKPGGKPWGTKPGGARKPWGAKPGGARKSWGGKPSGPGASGRSFDRPKKPDVPRGPRGPKKPRDDEE